MIVRSLPKMTVSQEVDVRAFYMSFGLRAETIERAIKARNPPAEENASASSMQARESADETPSRLRRPDHPTTERR